MKNLKYNHTKIAFLMDLSIEYYRYNLPNKIKKLPKFCSSYIRKILYHLRKIGMASYKRIVVVDWKKIDVRFCYLIISLSDFNPDYYSKILKFLNNNQDFIELYEHLDGDIKFITKMCYRNDDRKDFLVRIMSEMEGIKSIQCLDVIDYDIKYPIPLIH